MAASRSHGPGHDPPPALPPPAARRPAETARSPRRTKHQPQRNPARAAQRNRALDEKTTGEVSFY
eukprot:6519020-Prymnesium_polylepis.1